MIDCYLKIEELLSTSELNICYHSECYKRATNKTLLERLKSKHGSPPDLSAVLNEFKYGCSEIIATETPTSSKKSLRSQNKSYCKDLCVICQKQGGKLHNVMKIAVGKKLLDIAKQMI